MIPVVPQLNLDYRFVLAVGVVVVGLYLYAKHEIGSAVKAVGTAVNPFDERNLPNRAVTAIGEQLTGSKPGTWSLGSWLYDVFNKPYDPNEPRTPVIRNAAAKASPVQPRDKPTAYLGI